jgi:hypothetical protein
MTGWRQGAATPPHDVEDLPAEVAERCIALCREYGLQFGAIHFARRSDGGYRFFEVNPNGQWAWIAADGLPLRARLAELLVGVAVTA